MITIDAPRPLKIQSRHLERWAIVYVRQSHPQQVQRHRESAEVQANLKHLALGWGWPAERVRVLDGDQGCSGATTVGRDDFAWLLSEIGLNHVGLVMGFQINRLAREDEACCRLIKVCSVFDTLLADLDGLYHPDDFNDRLVLTVKGLVGGVELYQLQQRMQAGRLNKARRGEWLGDPPLGYVIGLDSKLHFDPDEQVQAVVRLIFEQFESLGSISRLLRYLVAHQIQLPIRSHRIETKGQLEWRRPHRETLRNLLRRAVYAGAYTWGRRKTDPRRATPGRRGTGQIVRKPQDCTVFLPNHHDAYISWVQYETHVRQLNQHRQHGPQPGPKRQTVSLLAGLVVCGQCGCRMQTRYARELRYVCQRRALDYGSHCCQSLAGQPLEELISRQVLLAVQPTPLELSLEAIRQCERERSELDRQWQLRQERGRQERERVWRQYNAVEPENRLVARTLERKLEEAIHAERTLTEEYNRFRQSRPLVLSASERAAIESLASNLPELWNSSQTSLSDKRQVVRLLVERVTVSAPMDRHEVTVQLHWAGGAVTDHELTRPVRTWRQLSYYESLMKRVRSWHSAGWKATQIAQQLQADGFHTPHGAAFTPESVRQLLSRGSTNSESRGHAGKSQ